MTATLGLNSQNDLYLGADGNIPLLNDLQATLAACETAVKAQLGEMIFATGQGIPNFQTIWKGAPSYAIYSSYLRRTLLSVSGVKEVLDLTLQVNGDTLSYNATILTIYGQGAING